MRLCVGVGTCVHVCVGVFWGVIQLLDRVCPLTAPCPPPHHPPPAPHTPPPPPPQVYFKGEHASYPEGGKMSQHFDSLAIGDCLEFKGPLGHFVYNGRGSYTLNGKVRATGTGGPVAARMSKPTTQAHLNAHTLW